MLNISNINSIILDEKRRNRKSISTLELDIIDTPCQSFPYLANPQTYKADTWDLTDDIESRTYWLNTFRDSTDKTAKIGRLGYILPVLDTLME